VGPTLGAGVTPLMVSKTRRGQQHPDGKSNKVSLMPATTGMKGSGYYDQHSQTQLTAIQVLQDWVDDAVAHLPLPAPAQPVTVLDLGSSEGRNAIRLMAAVVAGLRRRTDQPLVTLYNDLASNDFNQRRLNDQSSRGANRRKIPLAQRPMATTFPFLSTTIKEYG
jgi:hypothetical protein